MRKHGNAARLLLPLHIFNSLSTVTSLFGSGVWLFFSPHQPDVAKDLDRTRTCFNCVCVCVFALGPFSLHSALRAMNLVGSYFALQWLANVLVTALALGFCTLSPTAQTALFSLNVCVLFGLSGTVKNILCHRCLCEKARIMIRLHVGTCTFQPSYPFAALTPFHVFLEHHSLDDASRPPTDGPIGQKWPEDPPSFHPCTPGPPQSHLPSPPKEHPFGCL